MEMEQDDVIEVYQEQTGGAGDEPPTSSDQKTGSQAGIGSKSKTLSTVTGYLNKVFKFREKPNREDSGDKNVVSYSTKDDDVVRLAPLSL